MLSLDLLNELLTLLDDASTYHAIALSSRITSKLCQKNEVDAQKRFTMPQTNLSSKWYSLPNGTRHGPDYDGRYNSYSVYLNGKCEGPYWEWYTGSRYCSCHYHYGLLHGKYVFWFGTTTETSYYIKGNRV